MRTAFIETLCELAELDNRIWLLCGDLGYSVLERFAQRFPGRYVNMGVAEQNMTGVAAGLALEGRIVFTYSIANFPIMRCLEQIRNDVCYHNLNVKIVAVGGGMAYGAAGYTHHAVEDLAVTRAMPNMTVVAPGDPVEVKCATRAIINHAGPCYLRLGKGGEAIVHTQEPDFQLGKAIWLRQGDDITFVSTGSILAEVIRAADNLAARGVRVGVVSIPTLKPLDEETIRKIASRSRQIITVEEHSALGGLGEAVAGVLADAGTAHPGLNRVSLPVSSSTAIGTQTYLRQKFALDAASLVSLAFESMVG
jgi:transketolase